MMKIWIKAKLLGIWLVQILLLGLLLFTSVAFFTLGKLVVRGAEAYKKLEDKKSLLLKEIEDREEEASEGTSDKG